MSEKFDFEAALKAIQSGQAITGKDGVLAPLVKQLTEATLEGELDSHLADDVAGNRRNGKSRKKVKSTSGEFERETPRDRAGTFEPKLVKKYQRTVSDEIEAKILSMFGLGMSYSDIAGHVQELYGISVSTATISTITDRLIEEVKASGAAAGQRVSLRLAGRDPLQDPRQGPLPEQGGVHRAGAE